MVGPLITARTRHYVCYAMLRPSLSDAFFNFNLESISRRYYLRNLKYLLHKDAKVHYN